MLATGSLVAREEILVGPEVEGLRVTEVLADEGMRVKKGDVLARLVADTLDAQVAQNDAALARATAAIAQAKSAIVQAEARLEEAQQRLRAGQALARSRPHGRERLRPARAGARAPPRRSCIAARDGLKVAEAEKAQIEAQRRELTWRRGRTEVMAPADGIVSRRMARVGGYAAGAAEPMFRIVANGEVELDAEVIETRLAGRQDRPDGARRGRRRRRDCRQGAPRLARGRQGDAARPRAHLPGRQPGACGSAPSPAASSRRPRASGLAVPASAVLYGPDGASVQVVRDDRVETRPIKIGLAAGALVEVREGLAEGDLVVARSGTFLRDGDAVRPGRWPRRAPRLQARTHR